MCQTPLSHGHMWKKKLTFIPSYSDFFKNWETFWDLCLFSFLQRLKWQDDSHIAAWSWYLLKHSFKSKALLVKLNWSSRSPTFSFPQFPHPESLCSGQVEGGIKFWMANQLNNSHRQQRKFSVLFVWLTLQDNSEGKGGGEAGISNAARKHTNQQQTYTLSGRGESSDDSDKPEPWGRCPISSFLLSSLRKIKQSNSGPFKEPKITVVGTNPSERRSFISADDQPVSECWHKTL